MSSQEIQWLLKEKYSGEKTDSFFADCKRLALGEPLAYIIGNTPFIDCTIYLDNRPLIPRPETEFWTQEVIDTIKGTLNPSLGIDGGAIKVLDLCSGSGCIGTAVAKAIPQTHVDFGEIDEKLHGTIAKHLMSNDIDADRCNIFHTNLFSNVRDKYNFILTNPPYIDASLNRTDESVKTHEPYLALFGGKDGMEQITEIIENAPNYLVRGGQLWIEHEPEQSQSISDLAIQNHFSCQTQTDQFGDDRFSILVLQ